MAVLTLLSQNRKKADINKTITEMRFLWMVNGCSWLGMFLNEDVRNELTMLKKNTKYKNWCREHVLHMENDLSAYFYAPQIVTLGRFRKWSDFLFNLKYSYNKNLNSQCIWFMKQNTCSHLFQEERFYLCILSSLPSAFCCL